MTTESLFIQGYSVLLVVVLIEYERDTIPFGSSEFGMQPNNSWINLPLGIVESVFFEFHEMQKDNDKSSVKITY